MLGVKKDKDLNLALIGKSGVVGFVLWVWLFRYAFFFWAAFPGLFPGFWVVKLVGVSPIFFFKCFSCLRVLFLFLCWEGLWLGFVFDFLMYYFGCGKMSSSSSLCYSGILFRIK